MTEQTYNFEHYIDGQFISGGGHINVTNPATGQPIGNCLEADGDLVDRAVITARAAQKLWKRLPAIERAGHLRTIANKIRENAQSLARVIAHEQGKVLPLAEMEVGLTAEYLDYTAEWARRIEGEIISSDRPGENMFLFWRPMGVVAGILPWNFPLFMIARKAAPALLTGNSIIIKPSEETPFSAHAFAKIIESAGLPNGLFNMICGRGASVGNALVRHPGVDMVSFTGSTAAGSAIMASSAPNVTKLSLELGGKAPAIILDDANIDIAVGSLTASKSINTGQACNCAERVYVQGKVLDEFHDKISSAMSTIVAGDPFGDKPCEMGPLINRAAVDRLTSLVDDAKSRGASVLTGGVADQTQPGWHYRPTVVSGTTAEMDIMRKEIFGPVLVVNAIDSLEEGIERANDTEYGLTSSIFTTNINSAMKAISELEFGETYVNRENLEAIQGFHAGVKKSGIGGADGKHGLYEFMHTQVAYVQAG